MNLGNTEGMSGYVWKGYTYKSIDIEHSVLKQADFKPCFPI